MLVLGEGPTQGLDDTTITAEAKYPINFTQSRKKIVLSLHCNEKKIVFYLLMQQKISIQSKRFKNKTISIVFR